MDPSARTIFLWKGTQAPVRLKFIGSRAMGDTRKEVGFHYKIDVNDQDDETRAFKRSVFGEDTGPGINVFGAEGEGAPSYAEAAAAQGISISDDELRAKTAADANLPSHVAKMGGIGSRPQKSFLADESFFDESAPDPEPEVVISQAETQVVPQPSARETRQQVAGQIHSANIEEAQKLLGELGTPTGFERSMVVVGNRVYRSTGEDDVLFEELDNPLDGLFFVKEYTPRLVCENGRVIAIELLKSTGEEISAEDITMSQDLEDLAAMFQIEID